VRTVAARVGTSPPWQRAPAWGDLTGQEYGAASDAFGGLVARVERLQDAGLLGITSAHDAAHAFAALCEGLAVGELRSSIPLEDPERFWRADLGSLVAGFRCAEPA
jgi:hypothetical protein